MGDEYKMTLHTVSDNESFSYTLGLKWSKIDWNQNLLTDFLRMIRGHRF